MDGDLGSLLQSVLSDPEQMAKISRMAQGLMDAVPAGESGPEAPPSAAPEPPRGEAGILSALGRAFAPREEKNRSTALLLAMRPYMRPEKQEKLDRAMKIAKMARIAGAVMGEYGGGHGL